MTRSAIAEARAFDSWSDYQAALLRALAPLSAAQLAHRPIPGQRTAGEIAEHIVFGRALHVSRMLGDAASELKPLIAWGEDGHPPHTAAEIVRGLEQTWQVIARRLMQGSPGDALGKADAEVTQTIWGLLDHDLPHAGELSLVLGAQGLPGVEI